MPPFGRSPRDILRRVGLAVKEAAQLGHVFWVWLLEPLAWNARQEWIVWVMVGNSRLRRLRSILRGPNRKV